MDLSFFSGQRTGSGCSTWLEAYVKAIPFCIYPIVTLIILFLFSFGFFPKLGKMKEAYERVEKTGMVYGESSRKYNLNEESGEDGNIWDLLFLWLFWL